MREAEDIYSAETLEFADVARDNVFDWLVIEKPSSALRKFVEFMFYLVTFLTTFPFLFGLGKIRFALGFILMFAGLLSFLIFISQREKLPVSIWFAVIINISANVSQVLVHGELPIIGAGLAIHVHWLSWLIMLCYLVQNEAASKRVLIFLSVLIMLCIVIAGKGVLEAREFGVERLGFKEESFARFFAGSNALACLSGFLTIAFLFWSLQSTKLLRPFLWALSVPLVFIIFRAVSRQGILLFGCGLMVLMTAILMTRGVRLSGVVLILVALLIISQFGYVISSQLGYIGERFQTGSGRFEVYKVETLYELWDTKVFGKGLDTILEHTGITPHNTFVNVHLTLGGITAWVYAVWILVLCIRVFRMMRFKDLPLDLKLSVVALFGMALGEQMVSNVGYIAFTSIYAVAIVEKYTAPYSKRRMRERVAAQRSYYAVEDELSLVSDGSGTDGAMI